MTAHFLNLSPERLEEGNVAHLTTAGRQNPATCGETNLPAVVDTRGSMFTRRDTVETMLKASFCLLSKLS
jgi:hypothetical protein